MTYPDFFWAIRRSCPPPQHRLHHHRGSRHVHRTVREYCEGMAVSPPYLSLAGSFVAITHFGCSHRAKAIEILMAIHKRGLQHNDFRPRKIVVDDLENPQRIKVVDFQRCSPHVCGRKMEIAAYRFPPLWADFGCPELHLATIKSYVWTPGTQPL